MRKVQFAAAAAILLTVTLYACGSDNSNEEKKDPFPTEAEMVSRGEYLVATIGCDDCHSPKRMGAHGPELIPELRLSGYPKGRPMLPPDTGALKKGWMLMGPDLTSTVGPWGTSFAANITSDGTGVGNWTEAQFIKAMRTGKIKGLDNARPMLPPMPWFNFAKLTDEDLSAILAYLKSTPPVQNIVPAPIPPSKL